MPSNPSSWDCGPVPSFLSNCTEGLRFRHVLAGVALALGLGGAPHAHAATPPVPSQPTTTCSAIINGQCHVAGPFTLSSSSPGADHYEVCRSNDTTGWGGCDVVMSTSSGPSFVVSGSNLPSEGGRRAYRFRACDAADNCSSYSSPLYVTLSSQPPPVPSTPTTTCDAVINGECFVNGSFVMTSFSAGADRYEVCRSNDTTGWGGCAVVMSTNSGSSFTVSGSHLPSEGGRRGYRFRACDAVDNCSAYSAALYVSLDSLAPAAPSAPSVDCDMWFGNECTVNGDFVLSIDSVDGADHYRICRSQDTTSFGGCDVVVTGNTGTSFTISGSHLPTDGFRRAYRYSACDLLDNCSAWTASPPIYVTLDSTVLTCPSSIGLLEPRSCGADKGAALAEYLPAEPLSEKDIERRLEASLEAFHLARIDAARMYETLSTTGKLQLTLNGRSRGLVLEPWDLRADGYRAVAVTETGEIELAITEVHTFRGFVAGVLDSDVRLLVHPEVVVGYVDLEGSRYFVDPAFKFADGASPEHAVIYRERDLRAGAGVSCAATELHERVESLTAEDRAGKALEAAPGSFEKRATPRIVEIAIDADYEYFAKHGLDASATNAHILGVLNMVNGFYQAVGLEFSVTYQRVFTTPNDPYITCNAVTQWCEVLQEWERHQTGVTRDVAHLFSGKAIYGRSSLTGPYLRRRGLSPFGSICRQPGIAYVTTTDYREAGLVAHELGHALDARHLDEEDPRCPERDCEQDTCPATGPGGPVMCGSIQEPTTGFEADTVLDIKAYVATYGGCLTPSR